MVDSLIEIDIVALDTIHSALSVHIVCAVRLSPSV